MVTAANGSGGGASSCTLRNCIITGNAAPSYPNAVGGGVAGCTLRNCAVTGNSSYYGGGGAYNSTLTNCTVTENLSGTYGGGVGNCTLNNCVVYLNYNSYSFSNSYNSTFNYSCTAPAASGTGNITSDPLLLADHIHLSATSPCIGAGNASAVSGTDLDGQPWNNPPLHWL